MSVCLKCGKRPARSNGRCVSCYQTWKHRQQAYGRWDELSTYVDARPAHEHVLALRKAGLGLRRLVELTGLPRRTVFEVSRREPGKITRPTANAILAVPIPVKPHDQSVADGAYVDPTGTVRRLRALVSIGYSGGDLSRMAGHNPQYFTAIIAGERTFVTAQVARKVDALFDRLQNTPGSNARARNAAAQKSWPPPFAWDEDTIDDPTAKPNYGKERRYDFLDRYRDIRHHAGITDRDRIAKMLGISRDSLDRQIERYREELAS